MIFTDLSPGDLTAAQFKDIGVAGASGRVDTDDRILYDSKTGRVFYDADGSGAGARQQFAIVDNHPTLTFQDFHIV